MTLFDNGVLGSSTYCLYKGALTYEVSSMELFQCVFTENLIWVNIGLTALGDGIEGRRAWTAFLVVRGVLALVGLVSAWQPVLLSSTASAAWLPFTPLTSSQLLFASHNSFFARPHSLLTLSHPVLTHSHPLFAQPHLLARSAPLLAASLLLHHPALSSKLIHLPALPRPLQLPDSPLASLKLFPLLADLSLSFILQHQHV